jgi:hypothetical protein
MSSVPVFGGNESVSSHSAVVAAYRKLFVKPHECATCGNPATCFGVDGPVDWSHACDDCCSHSSAYGDCTLLKEAGEK